MKLGGRRDVLWVAGVLAVMGVALCAGEFAPPAEGPIAFRRDRIPLDADTMVELSKQLETLARGLKPETARDRRGAAQMLALAMALDPANTTTRELLAAYQQDRHQPATDVAPLEKTRASISQYVAWLETPAAGDQGQALAACLKDVLIIADPQHPQADALVETGELGAWANWIPDVASYEAQGVVRNDESGRVRPRVVAPVKQTEILRSKAQVHTLLWRRIGNDDSSRWGLSVAPLQMTAIKVGENNAWKPPFSIMIGPGLGGGMFAPTGVLLCNFLKKQHDNLPSGYRISITSRELEQSIQSKKRQSISAAAAVLASSAITGREPEAIIMGQIDEAGAFKLPSAFWDQLLALGKGDGQRLVLPADAAAWLPSLLAMEKPAVFLEYEVLLAADFQQLLDLSAKTSDAALANTSREFREIRERVGSQDVRQYITNRFVRQRLGEILQETPCHFSAKMLLIQASGNRPTLVTRPVLAAELRRSLEPMDGIVKTAELVYAPWTAKTDNGLAANRTASDGFSSAEIAKFVPIHDLCRSRLDRLERYAEKNDRELLESTRKVIGMIRSLDKATRTRGYTNDVSQAIRSACGNLITLHKQTSELLAYEIGDPLAPPSP